VASLAVSPDDVRAAAQRIAGAVEHTPCVESRTLSRLTGARVFLKFENLQFTASFKERGALNCCRSPTSAAGRDRYERQQPCAGGRLPRGAFASRP
jgi:threonine dehydratase